MILMILIILSWGVVYKVSLRFPALAYYQEKCLEYWKGFGDQSGAEEDEVDKELEDRGVWISYLEMADFLKATDGSEKAFRAFAERMVLHSKEMGFNVIIFQVRPFGDALYASEVFPWSAYISSEQGQSPGYDPLEIMVNLCHEHDMYIEAWINPYRIATDDMELSEDNPASGWIKEKSRNVLHYKGIYYYNPSSRQVRELIAKGVREIVSSYDIDGIHMDDYFYPEFTEENVEKVFDAADYFDGIREGKIPESLSISEWRRKNVDDLVGLLYKTVKDVDKEVLFGISPNGNPDLLSSDLIYYVNLDRWLEEEGFVDYIMPQLYWGYHNRYAPFEEVLGWWDQKVKGSHVTLYIGLQAYKIGGLELEDGSGEEEEMMDPELLTRQIRTLDVMKNVNGFCVFSYQYLDPDHPCFFTDEDKDSSSHILLLRDLVDSLDKEKDFYPD